MDEAEDTKVTDPEDLHQICRSSGLVINQSCENGCSLALNFHTSGSQSSGSKSSGSQSSGSQSSGSQSSGIVSLRRSYEYLSSEPSTSPPKPIKKRKVQQLEVKIEPDILMDISEVKQIDIKTEIDDVAEANQIVDKIKTEEESSEYDNVNVRMESESIPYYKWEQT